MAIFVLFILFCNCIYVTIAAATAVAIDVAAVVVVAKVSTLIMQRNYG